MENTDSYLHKKFKKQVNVDAKIQHDKENKRGEEKIDQKENEKETDRASESDNRLSNHKELVPNQSTKISPSSHTAHPNFFKSSISLGNQSHSSNAYISHVVSKRPDHHRPSSFDTKFTDQQTNYNDTSTSSILNNAYTTENYKYADGYASISTAKPEESSPPKPEEQRQHHVGGKYVCPYCNLVCSKPSVLQKHIRAHTNERPYPCESCGFSFKTRSNLYKHCRSRTHANRLMGTKTQETNVETDVNKRVRYSPDDSFKDDQQKPYKPRFHTSKPFDDDDDDQFVPNSTSAFVSHQINEIINRNSTFGHNDEEPTYEKPVEEPLNLMTNNRKRSLSEATEPQMQKSLIKELLLKSLNSSDMQCPHCKMIFQTVTELDVHKYKSCKGKPSSAKYSRSSSVNVASILTHNKNAFDHLPQLQFPLNSPGPFLGKTRLIDGDKTKSFSFDSGHLPLVGPGESPSPNYLSSPLPFDRDKKPRVKLFGGEVKVHSSGETKSFKMDGNEEKYDKNVTYADYSKNLSENRVVKTSLQSGGTVLTNSANFKDVKTPKEAMMMMSTSIDFNRPIFTFDRIPEASDVREPRAETSTSYPEETSPMYKNIMDFSQKALRMLTPNIRQPHLDVSTAQFNRAVLDVKQDANIPKPIPTEIYVEPKSNLYKPLNILVNGKVVRHVPGMPGPVVAAETPPVEYTGSARTPNMTPPLMVDGSPKMDVYPDKNGTSRLFVQPDRVPDRIVKSPINSIERRTTGGGFLQPEKVGERLSRSPKSDGSDAGKSTDAMEGEMKKFARPNSLALKPTVASLKQHHGLTPTMFNQILISPDTPRVAKKYAEHFLHGNYFSYLGLKSSTRPVYCTLNKTQPFYVPYFKKLSMYSEWRQQDTKQDKLYVSNYDSRQKSQSYSTAGKISADLIIHSSYKFVISETLSPQSEKDDEPHRNNTILGGYECNEDYIYVRGRGRGRYVCDQCGIRCKKPSMLKKHIRTHSNDRPYTCSHCNFSFKTKGNLTKHMKSKAHSKNSTTSNGSSSSSAHQSAQSSESETEDSGMDSSDESTRQQEHEAAYGLLSLSQKPTQTSGVELNRVRSKSPTETFMTSEEIAHVSKANYAKNKTMDERQSTRNSDFKNFEVGHASAVAEETAESQNIRLYLGMGSISRPLTYPYTTILPFEKDMLSSPKIIELENEVCDSLSSTPEQKSIKQFHVIQKYVPQANLSPNQRESTRMSENYQEETSNITKNTDRTQNVCNTSDRTQNVCNTSDRTQIICNTSDRAQNKLCNTSDRTQNVCNTSDRTQNVCNTSDRTQIICNTSDKTQNVCNTSERMPKLNLPTLKINDVVVTCENVVADLRKRKFAIMDFGYKNKIQKNDEVMDLSMTNNQEKLVNEISDDKLVNNFHVNNQKNVTNEIFISQKAPPPLRLDVNEEREDSLPYKLYETANNNNNNANNNNNGTVLILRPLAAELSDDHSYNEEPVKTSDYDNSAMETLADIATKQVKLEKNTLAKSVASEFLKLATKNENVDGGGGGGMNPVNFGPVNKDVNDIIVKSEGNKSCTICSKSFNKPSQLRLHMNIHYLERPFRCDTCSISFRTKGHLQKHERSASHNNKLSSSPALSSSEPRPFKCSDCSIAFRIHGHLAKHLRSKMHIQRLECLKKLPFGLYAELERSNSLLTEINTCDGDQCLESLKTLAKKVFINHPNKLNDLEHKGHIGVD